MTFGPASQLGVSLFEETPPVEWVPGRSEEEIQTIIRAVYRQVLGNIYVMDSEQLTIPESQFKRGEFSVREFVRAVAKSGLYYSRFCTDCPRYRTTELNHRHLLGRAPRDLQEMEMHSDILDQQGFEADIDSYIDSDEYQSTFGENIVPYIRGYKSEACDKMVQFTHLFQLVRGSSSSSLRGDISGNRPKLNSLVIADLPSAVNPTESTRGVTFREPPLTSRSRHSVDANVSGPVYRIEVTGRRASTVEKRTPKFRRFSNKVYLVPLDELLATSERIKRQGGVIASIKKL